MTLNLWKRWCLITLAVLLVVALSTFLWRALREPEFVYQGKPVKAWLRRGVIGGDREAEWFLWDSARNEDPVSKARIQKELVRCVMNCLNTKDNPLWKPYTLVRTSLPPFVAKVMPAWQEPRSMRWGAAVWLNQLAAIGVHYSAQPALFQRALPILCDLALHDADEDVRSAATMVVGRVGTFSPESLQIVLRALNSTNHFEVSVGAMWFARYPVDPERVVPLLVQGFEDSYARSYCASAVRAYGTRAKFAVERLNTLARSKDPELSSAAISVLQAIDPEAAKEAGLK